MTTADGDDSGRSGRLWETVFPFDEPYEGQATGIEHALDVVGDGGYLAMEGACGTGKTAIALTAGLTMVRDDATPLSRVLAVTPVKTQLAQFVEEARAINRASGPHEPTAPGIELVGKPDLHPYLREDVCGGEVDESLDDLRETTRALLDPESGVELRSDVVDRFAPDVDPNASPDEDDRGWGWRASTVFNALTATAPGTPLETAGVATPFGREPPTLGDVAYLSNQTGAPVDESDHLDPFLVGHYHHAAAYPVGFGDGE
ncbi:hypothetical protein DMJ13_27280, partial [halophilic archaeon]